RHIQAWAFLFTFFYSGATRETREPEGSQTRRGNREAIVLRSCDFYSCLRLGRGWARSRTSREKPRPHHRRPTRRRRTRKTLRGHGRQMARLAHRFTRLRGDGAIWPFGTAATNGRASDPGVHRARGERPKEILAGPRSPVGFLSWPRRLRWRARFFPPSRS